MSRDVQNGIGTFEGFSVENQTLIIDAKFTRDGVSFKSRQYRFEHILVEEKYLLKDSGKSTLDVFLEKFRKNVINFTVARDEHDIFIENERSLSEILVTFCL